MRWSWLFAAALVISAAGCGQKPAATPPGPSQGTSPATPVDEVKQTIKLKGFDPKGEPILRVMADGSLLIVFNSMPPSFVPEAQGLGPFADFDKQLERAAGVPVVWDDREVFVIQQPRPDTLERVRKFIEGYQSK
jgi:predicted small lipoprotein YifL